MTMMMKLVMVAGALSLVACGSGKEWDGTAEGPPGPEVGGAPMPGGPSAFGGASIAEGGDEASSRGGTGSTTGGTSMGGISSGGLVQAGGGYSVGGESSVPEGGAGIASGGEQQVGCGATGGDSSHANCRVNVAHCFDAAAKCFEYSPASDCDQIVDVCAAMQAECDATTP